MSGKTIRIGCASGFWGDSTIAAPQLLAGGNLNYLVFDYLAEITMSIMARARAKDPRQGYAHDFVTLTLRHTLPDIARQGVKVVANAGGVNPLACSEAIAELVRELGLNLKVATVTGDDLMDSIDDYRAQGVKEMFCGDAMPAEFMSVNAYLGAFPIAAALDRGADIVITGRCVDSAVTLGPCIHEFGWTADQYDALAGGCLAGHIIECGAQATGGLFTDWRDSTHWENIGYPIVEVENNGEFIVTKPEGTGGLVSPATVAEQLVYEIGDPQAYILPDVICDFSQVELTSAGDQCVAVKGTKGGPPTDKLKVSATYRDGFRLGCYVTVAGIDAKEKAQKVADAVLTRVKGILKLRHLPEFTETSVEIIGAEACYGPHARVKHPREVIIKLAAKHPVPEILGLLLRELTSTGTSMAPGISGMGGNRPKPSPVVRLFSFLVDKADVTPVVHVDGEMDTVDIAPGQPFDPASIKRPAVPSEPADSGECVEVPLIAIAHGRSGDKGNDANIGIIARKPEYLPFIRQALTEETVANYFAHFLEGSVERYEIPGIHALNFVLHNVLGGGGIASLRNDPQGKAYAQMLLDHPVSVPLALATELGCDGRTGALPAQSASDAS